MTFPIKVQVFVWIICIHHHQFYKSQKMNIELRKYYKLRRRIGFLFCHLGGLKFYLKLVDKIANKSKETGFYGVPSAISNERGSI